jgi:hypothetical protein
MVARLTPGNGHQQIVGVKPGPDRLFGQRLPPSAGGFWANPRVIRRFSAKEKVPGGGNKRRDPVIQARPEVA